MFELFCLLIIICYVINYGHVAILNGFFWVLDARENIDQYWSFDTMLTTFLVPVGFTITAIDLYLLYGHK